ncbi:hypothetical protein ACHQM5_029040 [Ranunculus cassubicifolius]
MLIQRIQRSLTLKSLLKCASSSSIQPHLHTSFESQTPFQSRNFHKNFPKGVGNSLGFNRNYSKFATGYEPLKRKPLDSILDIHRAKDCSPEDLVSVWDDFHIGRGHIGLSMKPKLYHLLNQRATSCRHFVIPLRRGNGYMTMFVQVQMPHIIFTGLEDYKARGTQAAPYFTATYYTEFAETKDTVLIRGDVVFTSKLTDMEAQWLLETAQSFYLNDVRYKLVEQFNKETRDFEFNDVLRALEMSMG